jgi:SanA protein
VKRVVGTLVLVLIGLGLLAILAPFVLRAWVSGRTQDRIYPGVDAVPWLGSQEASPWPAAIVFGAGYWPSGRLSDALADRMETAIALYESGKVNRLFLTGDNRFADYNEPAMMAAYAEGRGVPREALVLDYAGRRTYDSCYRARDIFGLERAVLVTQAFHLPRALYTCDCLGLDVVGVVADRHQYVYGNWYGLREVLALTRAWFDVNLFRPSPVLGDPIPVDWAAHVPENGLHQTARGSNADEDTYAEGAAPDS